MSGRDLVKLNPIMRITTTLTNSLALLLPLLPSINADDGSCVGGLFRLRIYTRSCEGLSVSFTGDDNGPKIMVCGEEMWKTAKDGVDGYPMLAEIPIDRADITSTATKFTFYHGPKDHFMQEHSECTLTFKEDPCVRNLVYKVGWGLDSAGPGQVQPYNFEGWDTMSLICVGDVDLLWKPAPS